MLDKLDQRLLKAIEESPGATIAEIIRPFLGEKSQRSLRDRIQDMIEKGLIRTEKERHYVRCYLVAPQLEA